MLFGAFFGLRVKMRNADAAAIAATFGSISAVTFITAISFLDDAEIAYSGYMVAAMALMESPAIISGVLLARLALGSSSANGGQAQGIDWKVLLHESSLNGAVVLLIGAMLIGYVTGESGWASVKPLMHEPFKGVLCLFLLDMGLIAAKRLEDLRAAGLFLLCFGVFGAAAQGLFGVGTAWLIGLGPGDALLLAILFGSASYIAVPAALRMALPQANPSLYIPLALAVTFPFNIIVGLPTYHALIGWSGF